MTHHCRRSHDSRPQDAPRVPPGTSDRPRALPDTLRVQIGSALAIHLIKTRQFCWIFLGFFNFFNFYLFLFHFFFLEFSLSISSLFSGSYMCWLCVWEELINHDQASRVSELLISCKIFSGKQQRKLRV